MNGHRNLGSTENWRDGSRHIAKGWQTTGAALVGLSFRLLGPLVGNAFGWSIVQVAFSGTLLSIMIMIVTPAQDLLIDRFGPRRVVLCSIPAVGLAYAGMALIQGHLWQFYMGCILVPALAKGLWPGSYVKATVEWFDRRLGLAVAIATSGLGLGAAEMPIIFRLLSISFGWRASFAICGLARRSLG